MRNYRELSESEVAELERLYPVTTNRELRIMFDISIDAIQDRFATPRGWKKDMKALKIGSRNGQSLTEKQEKWILNHYQNTKNADIMQKLGIGESTLHRFARKHGLKKTQRYMKKVQAEANAKAMEAVEEYNLMYKGMPQCPWLKGKNHFEKGVSMAKRLGKRKEMERLRKAAESLRETRRKERCRAKWGLEQQTKFKFSFNHDVDRRVSVTRNRLRKLGYIVERGSNEAYYDENTRRVLCTEALADRRGITVRPIEDKGKPIYDDYDIESKSKFERHA